VLAAVRELAALLPPEREPSPIDTALDHALATAPAQRDPQLVAQLAAVAGRVLG
jgi:5'-methylthioadenosine phosphorylase